MVIRKWITLHITLVAAGVFSSSPLCAGIWGDIKKAAAPAAKTIDRGIDKVESDIENIPGNIEQKADKVIDDIEGVRKSVVQRGKTATQKMKDLGIDTAEAAKHGLTKFGTKFLEQALIVAAISGDKADVEGLLEYDGVDVNARGTDGITALMMAAFHQHAEIVDYLINHKAKLNLKDSICSTALAYAKDPFIKPAKGPVGADKRTIQKHIIEKIKKAGGREYRKVNGRCKLVKAKK